MKDQNTQSRRRFLKFIACGAGSLLSPRFINAATSPIITKTIPSSNEKIPAIGLGSSRTFNVGNDSQALDNVAEVMRHFFIAGGSLIDSSPMYGSSQPAIGYGLNKLGKNSDVFAADKVWTWNTDLGSGQMEKSRKYWNIDAFDLMQVHNLVEWEEHLELLKKMKKRGEIRYIGITTSHGRQHDELAEIMKTQPLDFVQFSYNIIDREVEEKLLPLAREHGIATIINRPFQRGDLIDELEDKPLPSWAAQIGCENWSQFLLKFVVSHPDVTCTIPATSQVAHIKENMLACYGKLPDQAMRTRMIEYVEKII